MRSCRVCGTIYDDPNMRYCLTDGSQLEPMTPLDDMETVIHPGSAAVTNADSPPRMTQTTPMPAPKRGMSLIGKVMIGVLILGFLGLALSTVGLVVYYTSIREKESDVVIKKPDSPRSPVSPEKNKSGDLEKSLEDLEKQLDEAGRSIPNMPSLDDLEGLDSSAGVGRVNSPKDGFLALRSLPGTEQGERLAKIPNGETVVIYGCTAETTVDGKKGKWCRAIYKAKFGWIFDGFLNRI